MTNMTSMAIETRTRYFPNDSQYSCSGCPFKKWVYGCTTQQECNGGVDRTPSPDANAFPRIPPNLQHFLIAERTFYLRIQQLACFQRIEKWRQVNRCAAQNQNFSANCEARLWEVDYAGLKRCGNTLRESCNAPAAAKRVPLVSFCETWVLASDMP